MIEKERHRIPYKTCKKTQSKDHVPHFSRKREPYSKLREHYEGPTPMTLEAEPDKFLKNTFSVRLLAWYKTASTERGTGSSHIFLIEVALTLRGDQIQSRKRSKKVKKTKKASHEHKYYETFKIKNGTQQQVTLLYYLLDAGTLFYIV